MYNKKMIRIFSDGSSLGNPGPGGWGAIVALEDKVVELGGFEDATTNNRMEMKAALEALRSVVDEVDTIEIFTDSKYLVQGMTSWVFSWQKNGWKTQNKSEVLNRDLWEALSEVAAQKTISWNHVDGHAGVPANERVDQIANGFASKLSPNLYNGPRDLYAVDLSQTKADSPAKKSGSSSSSAKAFSYLSLIDGELMRHETWKECEARVKGKNAKFKKALSADHEKEIMKEWGIVSN